jgi:hypothetical protein
MKEAYQITSHVGDVLLKKNISTNALRLEDKEVSCHSTNELA